MLITYDLIMFPYFIVAKGLYNIVILWKSEQNLLHQTWL